MSRLLSYYEEEKINILGHIAVAAHIGGGAA